MPPKKKMPPALLAAIERRAKGNKKGKPQEMPSGGMKKPNPFMQGGSNGNTYA